MTDREIQVRRIADALDLAVLKPTTSADDVQRACALANKHGIKSVCVAPIYVPLAASLFGNVSSVIGFPHGDTFPRVKYEEARTAIIHGAKELDVVINYGRFLDGDDDALRLELAALAFTAHDQDVLLKAILETCYYTPEQLRRACRICVECDVDFVKTSTGFAREGATPGVIQTMLDTVAGQAQVKASGGIHSYADAVRYLDMGCTRLGSSNYSELLP